MEVQLPEFLNKRGLNFVNLEEIAVRLHVGWRNPWVCSFTNWLCRTEHFSQSTGLGLLEREEELR